MNPCLRLTPRRQGDRSEKTEGKVVNIGSDSIIDPYRLLQIRRDATREEIKQAYSRAALWYHPGRTCTQVSLGRKERDERLRMFTVLAACCQTLLDRESRVRLDALLKGRRKPFASDSKRNTSFPSIHRNNSAPEVCETSCSPTNKNDRKSPRRASFLQSSSSGISFPMLSQTSSSESDDDNQARDYAGEETWMERARRETPGTSRISKRRPNVLASYSTEDMDHIHYTEAETDRLFGGPLSLLYQARLYKSFLDPFAFFEQVFGSKPFPSTSIPKHTSGIAHAWDYLTAPASPHRASTRCEPTASPERSSGSTGLVRTSAHWKGSRSTLPDGSIVYTTCHTVHRRKVVKVERITIDPKTGKKHSTVTVTAEDIVDDEDSDEADDEPDYSGETSECSIKVARKKKDAEEDEDLSSADNYYWSCCSPTLLFAAAPTTEKRKASSDEAVHASSGKNNRIFNQAPMTILRRINCVV